MTMTRFKIECLKEMDDDPLSVTRATEAAQAIIARFSGPNGVRQADLRALGDELRRHGFEFSKCFSVH